MLMLRLKGIRTVLEMPPFLARFEKRLEDQERLAGETKLPSATLSRQSRPCQRKRLATMEGVGSPSIAMWIVVVLSID